MEQVECSGSWLPTVEHRAIRTLVTKMIKRLMMTSPAAASPAAVSPGYDVTGVE
jgi:hypothetical protein